MRYSVFISIAFLLLMVGFFGVLAIKPSERISYVNNTLYVNVTQEKIIFKNSTCPQPECEKTDCTKDLAYQFTLQGKLRCEKLLEKLKDRDVILENEALNSSLYECEQKIEKIKGII